jgi:hypothetical protein
MCCFPDCLWQRSLCTKKFVLRAGRGYGSHLNTAIVTYLWWLRRVGATPCCLMEWRERDTCYCHTGYDAVWKGRGTRNPPSNMLENPYPVPTSPDRRAEQTDVSAPTPIDHGCPEWDAHCCGPHCWFPGHLHDVRSGHSAISVNLWSFVNLSTHKHLSPLLNN